MNIHTFRNIAGFTLIELMVVVGIFAFMSGLILANYPRFNAQIILENTAHEVALEVRQAQNFGLGVRETSRGTGEYPAYGVYIPEIDGALENKTKVYLYADVNNDQMYEGGDCIPGGGECIEVLTLRNHHIAALCGDIKTDHPSADVFRTTDDVIDFNTAHPLYCNKDSIDVLFTRPNPDAFPRSFIDGGSETTHNDIAMVVSTPRGNVRTVVVWSTGQITVE
ncbi:MAG: type II secretion system protein [Parcubacteria group bacterium]|nr:type II secretion system protein [Parcubacteria group bacterium]